MRGNFGARRKIDQDFASIRFSFLRDFADLDVVREIFISSYCDLEIDFRGRQFWRTIFSFDQA